MIHAAIFLEEKKQMIPYWQEGLQLAQELNDKAAEANYLVWRGGYHKSLQQYDSALLYIDAGMQLIPQPVTPLEKITRGHGLHLKGQLYEKQENYYRALSCYFESAVYYSRRSDMYRINYTNIANVYSKLGNEEKALEYHKAVAALEQESGAATTSYIGTYAVIAHIYLKRNDYTNTRHYLNLLQPYMPSETEPNVTAHYYRILGNMLAAERKYSSACRYLEQSLYYLRRNSNTHPGNTTGTLNDLAQLKLAAGETATATQYALQSLDEATRSGKKQNIANALTILAACYNSSGQPAAAYAALQQATAAKDSVLTESNTRQANTLAALYENDKKEKAITQLKHEKNLQASAMRHQSQLNIIFLITLAALLAAGILLYRYYKDKQKIQTQQQLIQQQKINELEKEKQFTAINAMLKGQEEERSRLAKDLHDGLGGLLSGLKFSFIHQKDNSAPGASQIPLLEQSVAQLDHIICELRKVSHNLMPEALQQFGLRSAVKDFCQSIELTAHTKIIFELLGSERPLNQLANVNIYRIIQELVHNAIRHGQATQVLVQLSYTPLKLLLTVEDNGSGFDIRALEKPAGIGFTNIERRVNYFGGRLEIHSRPGDGTIINIELIV
jgi:signal transduction histidine kinase